MVNGYDMVYNWFDIISAKGNAVTGYIIMPNHIHLLLYYAGGNQSLNMLVGNGKRFMAYDIVKRLRQQKATKLLAILQDAVQPIDRARRKKHEIWEDSFDVKHCRTESFVLQKLNYIHKNPCAGKWRLAESLVDYPHSSARFYISGRTATYKVIDYREFIFGTTGQLEVGSD
jgi:REP element-mobilizing transposase RayT